MKDRTQTAKDHDDSELIDRAEDNTIAGGEPGREGGNIQRDVGTQDEMSRVDKPDTHTRVTKEDEIANGERYPKQRPGG
ncbi:hypothetical protein [Stakelama tenebrarum]|uniref:Uncharacterized protein n=1 Tax=Stakelama tenebrarum TaxID=2711215 RepID=A0A6G6Y5D9_9SPHN|nr:hypothetical protein [Sphingosinithalassobacter tenebrarum]QIG80017.1 hypothetical protein G5C33_09660 [Sphingosinithalassobacter tenebrarum]